MAKVPDIIRRWNAKQEELKKQGMDKKKITNLAVIDKWRNKELIALKGVGGPFTSAEDIDMYLQLEDMNKISNLACTLNSDMQEPQAFYSPSQVVFSDC